MHTPSVTESGEIHLEHEPGHDDGHIHVTPVQLLIAVFVALLTLTALTVFSAGFDLGPLNIWVAMGIATVKATLVALYFMHLRYDNPFNLVVFLSCFLFVGVFIGIAMMDSHQYQPAIDAVANSQTVATPPPAPVPATPEQGQGHGDAAAPAAPAAPAKDAGHDAKAAEHTK